MDDESAVMEFIYNHKSTLLDSTARGRPALESLGGELLTQFPHLFIAKKMTEEAPPQDQIRNNYYKTLCGGIVLQLMIEEGYRWIAKNKKTKRDPLFETTSLYQKVD